MSIFRKILPVAAMLLVTACASSKGNPSANFSKVIAGQEQAEVLSLLGPPQDSRFEGGYEIWVYTVYTDFGPTVRSVYLRDGFVSRTGTETERQYKMQKDLAARQKISDEISRTIEAERKREAKEKSEAEMRREALLIKKKELELKNRELALKEAYLNFNRFYASLGSVTYAYQRYDLIASSLGRYYLTSSQVARVLSTFRFTSEKIKALRLMRYRIIDPGNRYIIVNHFSDYKYRAWANHVLVRN